MTSFLAEYGLFLLKVITVVAGIVVADPGSIVTSPVSVPRKNSDRGTSARIAAAVPAAMSGPRHRF